MYLAKGASFHVIGQKPQDNIMCALVEVGAGIAQSV
jgi:hypothetical protein